MKLKFLPLLLLLLIGPAAFAQYKVSIFINGIMSGQYDIKEDQTDGGIWYKKKVYKNLDRLVIQVSGKSIKNTMYKRTVDVNDDELNSIFMAPETPGISGQFILTDKAVIKRLSKGKMVKLFLQMDPANDKSKAPSRRIFIGNLIAT